MTLGSDVSSSTSDGASSPSTAPPSSSAPSVGTAFSLPFPLSLADKPDAPGGPLAGTLEKNCDTSASSSACSAFLLASSAAVSLSACKDASSASGSALTLFCSSRAFRCLRITVSSRACETQVAETYLKSANSSIISISRRLCS